MKPKSSLTFSKCLDMGLMDHVDQIAKIAEVAGKEFAIEQALEKMEKDWTPVNLEVSQVFPLCSILLRISILLPQIIRSVF